MKTIRARHLGMCFGVRDAIALARSSALEQPLTILGELVHNQAVLTSLERDGIRVETDPARVQTRRAMVTAHGASDMAIETARSHGLEIFEGTCPLVHHAHSAVRRLVAEGYHPVIIGKRDHVEVRGIIEDLAECDVILSEEDVLRMQPRAKIGIASQTTQPIDRVQALVELVRTRFPGSDVKFVDTVCQPTKNRQRAAQELARDADVVVVIGGVNSNNTRELVNTCGKFCARVHHVQGAEDLKREWFAENDMVGITAGTSTPDELINEVEEAIRRMV